VTPFRSGRVLPDFIPRGGDITLNPPAEETDTTFLAFLLRADYGAPPRAL
jgi:hypothetical protein